jgi:hypothetical protein
MLQPVQRRFPRQRRTARPPRRQLAQDRTENRVVAKLVVIEQILIAKRDPDHPLAHQRHQPVLDIGRRPPVAEACRKPPKQPDSPIGLGQE